VLDFTVIESSVLLGMFIGRVTQCLASYAKCRSHEFRGLPGTNTVNRGSSC